MARNAIESEFRTSKMPDGSHFCQKFPNKKEVVYQSEMGRNAIESEFRTSKMGAGGHFVKKNKKKIKLRLDLKWPEMRSKKNFRIQNGRRQPFCKKITKKIKLRINLKWPEMWIESEFRTSKMGAGGHFVTNFQTNKNSVLI